jgi:hypothetical protein
VKLISRSSLPEGGQGVLHARADDAGMRAAQARVDDGTLEAGRAIGISDLIDFTAELRHGALGDVAKQQFQCVTGFAHGVYSWPQ